MMAYSQLPSSGTESFENTLGPDTALPTPQSIWTLPTGMNGNQWAVFDNGLGLSKRWSITSNVNNVYSGQNSAIVEGEQIGINNISEDYLATPLLFVPPNGILSFWTKSNFTNYETTYSIKVNTNTGLNSQTTIANYNINVDQWSDFNLNTSGNSFVKKEINLSAFAGQTIFIAFVKTHTQQTSNFIANDWIIDDVNISSQQCQAPTNLTTSLITNTTAILSWTSQQASTSWEILLLPYGSPTPTASSYGIITTSNPYVVTGLNPTVCYTFYVKSNCGTATPVLSDWSSPSSFCILDCTNNAQCPESLQLIAFLDSNNNGTKESNEDFFSYGNFVYNINNSGTYLYGNSNNGSFSIFDSNPSNTYNLSFTIDPSLVSYCNTSTVYSNITIPSGSASNYYYFPITQLQTYNDLEVQMVLNGNPRPGFVYYNTIYYKNKGTQTVNSGTVTFTKSPTVAINSVSQSGTTFTATGFAYNFTNLLPNEVRSIQVEMQVPIIPTVNLGDLITNSANVEPLIGDAFPNDNQASLSQIVVGSLDPNDKIEAHGGKIDIDDFSSNDYLTYTIQFENTGSANAQFIRVEDLLNASLDPNSIKMLNSSHNYNMRRIGNQLIWNFYNINLPPTSVNPSASHGFVQFKIKPTAGFTLGDIIPNKADIYFDYNPPIITNTFETKFVQSLRNSDFNTTDFVIYPNPTNSLVTISLQNSTENINSITIINILGKKVKEIANTTSSEINVDVSNLSKGIYLVEITTESNLKTIKKLVIN